MVRTEETDRLKLSYRAMLIIGAVLMLIAFALTQTRTYLFHPISTAFDYAVARHQHPTGARAWTFYFPTKTFLSPPKSILQLAVPPQVTKSYIFASWTWRMLVTALPPFVGAHGQALALLFAGVLGASALVLFARAERSRTRKFVELLTRRTAELRSLNSILVDDIEQRKAISAELERSQRQLRELAEHNARVKEDERKRIARDIHDDLGQSMLALRIDLVLLADTADGQGTRERLRLAVRSLDSVMNAMRGIINELRPSVLDLGLDAALEWEVAKFSRRTGIECALEVRGELVGLNDDIAAALYRIVQESMTNIMRHAQAQRVSLSLWTENGWIFLRLADDGVGMDPNCRRKSKSFGLIGISERIYALGGAFDTQSKPGEGTALVIAVPFAAQVALDVA